VLPTIVRRIVIVIAALSVATAGPGRVDEPRTRDHHVATLAHAPAAISAPAHRRDVHRDVPVVAVASLELAAPARIAVDATPPPASSVSCPDAPAPCSRGPPRG
jgi:hypothetical protein